MGVRGNAHDPFVSVLDEMAYGHPRPGSVFNTDGVRRGHFNRPIDGDDREGPRGERFQILVSCIHRDEQDAINGLMSHHLHLCGFQRWILVRSCQPYKITTLPGGLLNSVDHHREKGVRDVWNYEPDGS